MTEVVLAPMATVMLGVVATFVFRGYPRLQRAMSFLSTVVYAGAVCVLVRRVVFVPEGTTALSYRVGGRGEVPRIVLLADGLSVFMLSIAAVLAVYAVGFSVRFIDRDNQRIYYHPLFQFLLLGVTGAFLTGDLFNLFVWFEVMLMASYVFVSFYGNASQTAAGTRYVVLNVVGGVLMLLAIGGLYSVTGTLNMADMAEALSSPSSEVDTAPVIGLSALLLTTFGLKAGLVPFQFWVPSAYRAAPMPVTAMLAGVTKKVGIYAILRLYFTVLRRADVTADSFVIAGDSPLAFLAPVVLAMGLLSIVVGGVGAVSSERLDGILAYSSIGQVGFIAVPVGIAAGASSGALRHLAVVGALVYALHHALTKGLLFLSAAVIRDATGTTDLSRLGGIGGMSSAFSGVFFIGSLSLVGIPPLAGFFGKFFVFETAVRNFIEAPGGRAAVVGGVLLIGAVLTILYSTRAWVGSFWGKETEVVQNGRVEPSQVWMLVTLAGVVVLVGVGFEPVYVLAEAGADATLDTEGYIEAVSHKRGGSE